MQKLLTFTFTCVIFMRNESLGAERGKLELSSENFVHSSSVTATTRAAADQVGPHSTFTLAAGLHRNRGMSRASFFVCCRARRVDKVTTISMCVLFEISHLDNICLHWREMVNVLFGARLATRRRSILVVAIVVVVGA